MSILDTISNIFLLNFLYAVFGGILTILFIYISIKVLDKIIPFDTFSELRQDNLSVGLVFSSIIIGICIAMGLVIGYSMN